MKNLACGLETAALLNPVVETRNRTRSGPSVTIKVVLNTVKIWFERSESRRQLRRLNDRMLTDVGLSREQAQFEASKSFWQD